MEGEPPGEPWAGAQRSGSAGASPSRTPEVSLHWKQFVSQRFFRRDPFARLAIILPRWRAARSSRVPTD